MRISTMKPLGLSLLALMVLVPLTGCSPKESSAPKHITDNLQLLREGRFPKWCHKNNLITFDQVVDGNYKIFVMKPDGFSERCLTCNKQGVPQKHNGNPAWHPSGDYIVFTAEKENSPEQYSEFAIPGTGFNCDLWVMTSDREHFYQLTNLPLYPMRAVIHPQFSHDGKKILFSANLIPGQQVTGLDIYELDLDTLELTRLTSTLDDWDEHAHYSPDGKKIAWMSSTGYLISYSSIKGHEWARDLITEL